MQPDRHSSSQSSNQSSRQIKDTLYEQVARIGKAAASPKRLELLELLCQAPKSVDTLAREAGISIKLASAHLKELRTTRLVDTERKGRQVIYRIASPEIPKLWVMLRNLAEERLFELQDALGKLSNAKGEWRDEDQQQLLQKAERGEVVVIDVRPHSEYQQAHLPYARSMPVNELQDRLTELPKDKPIVAYCRGPYCLMAPDAVKLLADKGFEALHLRQGVAEWGNTP